MRNLQKPGEKPDKPGEYEERRPRGGKIPRARIVTMEPGDNPLPPTRKPGRKWVSIGPVKK